MGLLLNYIIFQWILYGIQCFPLNKNTNFKHVIPTSEQIKFMQSFGYLDSGQLGYAAQYSEETIIKALVNIQRFGAIEQTGILDSATIQLMTRRRCGVKDIFVEHERRRRSLTIGSGWKKSTITYSKLLDEEVVWREIKCALDTWGTHVGLTFIPSNESITDIQVSFESRDHGDKYPFDGPGNILAHAFFPNVKDDGGKVHFDNEENWSSGRSIIDEDGNSTTGFFLVALHELGHTLGLGHSDVETSIMFPYYSDTDSEGLDEDDIAGLKKLYVTMQNTSTAESTSLACTTMKSDFTTSPIKSYSRINNEITFPVYETTQKHEFNDICEGYDSIAMWRQELFVFKGNYVWRYRKRGSLEEGHPVTIQTIFPKLPYSVKRIDAAYERKNGAIVLFSGSKFWIYDQGETYGSFTLDCYQIPNRAIIDAVMYWPPNNKTYLFENDHFWRFDEVTNTLDKGYPKNITRWKGVPDNIDGAIHWIDGETYFFKGIRYWRFNNILIQTDDRYPLPTLQIWFGCPEIWN